LHGTAGAISAVRCIAAEPKDGETTMTRTFALFAAALALTGALIASESQAFAQERGSRWSTEQNWYGPGEYDRRVNGSNASTPGQP
jgi:hypothetical protein